MKLNIIGNGFDIYHGLPSKYYHFCCYLIEKDHEFFETLSLMYNFRYIQLVGPLIAHDFEYVVEERFWSFFELQLGKVNESYIFELLEDNLRLENDDPIEIEMDDYEIAEILKDYFNQWVMDTLDTASNYSIIRNSLNQDYYLRLKRNDRYLSFNYTHVLQNLYGIPNENIFYIHGESGIEPDNELIVGHGDNEIIQTLKESIQDLDQIYDYKQNSMNRMSELRCLLKYTEILKKDVCNCIYQVNHFFNSFEDDIDTICIYGLSCGDVDIPYLEMILKKYPKATWEFSYHDDVSKKKINETTKTLGIESKRYSTFMLKNDCLDVIQKKIIDFLNIKLIKEIPIENLCTKKEPPEGGKIK